MTKQLWIGAALLAAACSTQKRAAAPVPESSFDEKNQTVAATRGPHEDRFPSRNESVLAAGRGRTPEPPTVEPEGKTVEHAVAVMMPTQGSQVKGEIHVTAIGDGVVVTARIEGLPKGAHAFHVHELGDCSSPDAESAGAHFHFTGSSRDPDVEIITGNLGELVAEDDGTATLQAVIPDARLQGSHTIVGRSIVIHEKGNDASHPPDGAAGKRLACGVIGLGDEP